MIDLKIKNINYLIQTNNLDEAKKNIVDLLKTFPKNYDLNNLMGLVEAKKNNFEEAIKNFEKAIKIDPNLIGAYINIGVAYEKLEKLTQSVNSFKIALKINPKLEIIYSSLSKVLIKKKNYKDAIINLKKAIKINPSNYENYYILANVLSITKKYDEAIDNYKKVLKNKKDVHQISFLIAENYRKLKKFKEALHFYNISKNEKTNVRILECYLMLNLKNKYLKEINLLSKESPEDRRVAAVSSYISNQFRIENKYPFCPNPLVFIYKTNINKYFKDFKKYIAVLFNEITSQNFKWEPSGKTTVNGFGTTGNLSEKKLPQMNKLEKFISDELKVYYSKYKSEKVNFISGWPKNFKIVSWSNRLKKEGHNIPHIHPSGWISGVFYLKVPKKINKNEAGIEFSLHGDDYNIINKNIPAISFQPKIGDMVLFPSSLYHRTIPFSSNEERVCIAFDLCKDN